MSKAHEVVHRVALRFRQCPYGAPHVTSLIKRMGCTFAAPCAAWWCGGIPRTNRVCSSIKFYYEHKYRNRCRGCCYEWTTDQLKWERIKTNLFRENVMMVPWYLSVTGSIPCWYLFHGASGTNFPVVFLLVLSIDAVPCGLADETPFSVVGDAG